MNMKHFGAAATAAMLLSGTSAFAATVVIDDFTAAQFVTDVAEASQMKTSTQANTSEIGGNRTLTADNSSFETFNSNATTLASGGGVLAFSNDNRATGKGTVTYSELSLAAQIDSFFTFSGPDFDNGFELDFGADATDSDGTTITFREDLAGGFNPVLSFGEFMGDVDSFNFGDIASLTFFVDSTGRSGRVDGELGLITLTTNVAAVPVPAAGFLLVGALGGMAALRRRRKS